MTEITDPSKKLRRRALRINLTVRAASLTLFVLLMAGATAPVWVFGEPLGVYVLMVFPLGLFILFAMMLSPFGTLLSAFTLWTGFWINSCPYCMDVKLSALETSYLRCDGCGQEAVSVSPVAGGEGWFSRHGRDEPEGHYCSMECSGP